MRIFVNTSKNRYVIEKYFFKKGKHNEQIFQNPCITRFFGNPL